MIGRQQGNNSETAMAFVLTDEQLLLQKSAATVAERADGVADPHRHMLLAAEAGWLSLMVPERAGGGGLGMTEMALVLEQAGRGQMQGPLAACSVTAYAIGIGRAATVREKTLEDLVAGKRIIVPALQDPAASEDAQEPITAMPFHYGYQLSGQRSRVPFAAEADAFLIDARTSDGSIMVIIPRDIHGVEVSESETKEGRHSGIVTFSDASMMSDEWLIAGVKQGKALTEACHDRLLLGTSAEMLGLIERASRGCPAATLAVKDRTAIDRLRSLLYEACAAFDAKRGRRSMAAAVKAEASEAVLDVAGSVARTQDPAGISGDFDVDLFLKRAAALSDSYGDAALHRARLAELEEREAAAADGTTKRRRRPRRKKSIFARAVSR